jgi:gliding motility-associated-like protein
LTLGINNTTVSTTITVACAGDVPAMTSLTAIDNCCGANTVEGVDAITQGNCDNSFSIVRTWTFFDVCGNSSSVEQTINVFDDIAPVTPEAPEDITVACAGDVPAMTSLTAIDNCCGAITVEGVDAETQGNCDNSFSIVRTWTFFDVCGNSSSVAQTINVIDYIAPTFNQVIPENITASCDNIPKAIALTATDNCGNATVTINETIIQGSCTSNYQIIRTWTATDSCNNITSVTQNIAVSDTTGPSLVTVLPVRVDVTCDAIPVVPTLEFTDNCSAIETPVFTQTTSSIVDNVYTITRTWVVSDVCENLSQTYTQNIFVTEIADVIILADVSTSNNINENISLDALLPLGVNDGTWINVNNIGGYNAENHTFNPLEIATGNYLFSYTINIGNCLVRYDVQIIIGQVSPCENIIIHNTFTPNSDEFNQFFNIEHIEDTSCYPTNKVEIYNRWGVLVYETKNYDNSTHRFEGLSEGRTTVSQSEKLPTGTYFFVIDWTTTTGEKIIKDGYLY